MDNTNLRRLIMATQMIRLFLDQDNKAKLSNWIANLEEVVQDIVADE